MKMMDKKNINNLCQYEKSIKKPSSPHVMDCQVEMTEEERQRNQFVEDQLSELGISITVFDSKDDGCENPYILEAIILANKGEKIPDELKNKIKQVLEEKNSSPKG